MMLNKRKRISHNEAQWTLSPQKINPNDQANRLIQNKVDSETYRHFAKLNVGVGFFEWTFTCPTEPKTLTEASEDEKTAVMEAYNKLAEDVVACFGDSYIIGQRIMQVPNEDYIFYYTDDNGQIQIILTGWGFINKRNAFMPPKPPKKEFGQEPKPINIGFIREGEMLPNRAFLFKATSQIKPNELITSEDGFYHFDKPFKNGSEFIITDKESGKEFSLTTDASLTEFVFDITSQTSVNISVVRDGEPVAGKNITMTYRGNTQTLATDLNGNAMAEVSFIENENITIDVDDQHETQIITPDGNTFSFALNAITSAPIVKVVDQNGNTVSNYHLIVNIAGEQTDKTTDENGLITLQAMKVGEQFYVVDNDGGSQIFQVTEENEEHIYPVYIEEPVEMPPIPEPISPMLRVVDQNGNPVPGYNMMLANSQGEIPIQSDETGSVVLPPMNINDSFNVADQTGNAMTYQIAEGVNEFYFYVNIPEAPQEEPMVRIRVLDIDGTPLDNLPVYVDTPLGTFSSMSDNYGYALFPASAFVDKQKAKVRFEVTKEYRMRKNQS